MALFGFEAFQSKLRFRIESLISYVQLLCMSSRDLFRTTKLFLYKSLILPVVAFRWCLTTCWDTVEIQCFGFRSILTDSYHSDWRGDEFLMRKLADVGKKGEYVYVARAVFNWNRLSWWRGAWKAVLRPADIQYMGF